MPYIAWFYKKKDRS